MNKFKIGDRVRVIKLEDEDFGYFFLNEIFTIDRIDYDTTPNILFLEGKPTGLFDYQLEIEEYSLEPKKVFTIQEVLVKENIGKKFEFCGVVYILQEKGINNCDGLRLVCDSKNIIEYIEELEELEKIINGTFTLIEEPKPFTEEIDFKEALRRLCDGEEVAFEDSNEQQEILVYKDGILKYKPYDEGDFFEIKMGLEYVGVGYYNKYYKK